MTLFKNFVISAACVFTWFVIHLNTSYSQTDFSEQTLASDILTEDKYQPGSGLPVGKIQLVWGEAFVFHRDPTVAYRVQTGLPVYAGDIIRTRASSWVQCRLVDGSQISIASESELAVGRSICSSARKMCNSSLSLKQGDARFKLNPPDELVSYEFKIQADFAAATAAAADFVMTATADVTEFVALDKSRIEVTSPSQPEEITFLSEFQKTSFFDNTITPAVETVSREEIETILAEFYPVPPSSLFADSLRSDPAAENPESQLLDE
ncbi:MAG: FecR domain-containing protein [Desulfobacterales bacterium]|nr:FecR domain-containing protein [Desulfobacterales bacterium]